MPNAALTGAYGIGEELRRELGAASHSVRWVRPEGLHLTLRFLGEIEAERVDPILPAMVAAARDSAPIALQLGPAGAFGGRRPRVIWVGLDAGTSRLSTLAERLDETLAEAGFEARRGVFRPHITLGRVRRGASRSDLNAIAETVAATERIDLATVTTGIGLVESQLSPGGARYRRIGLAEL